MNDIRFSGITRVELHALDNDTKETVLGLFQPGPGYLKECSQDIFVGYVPDDRLNGEKLFIATGAGERPADQIIKEKLSSITTSHWSQDLHGTAGTFNEVGEHFRVDTGTLEQGLRGQRYLFDKNGQFVDLTG